MGGICGPDQALDITRSIPVALRGQGYFSGATLYDVCLRVFSLYRTVQALARPALDGVTAIGALEVRAGYACPFAKRSVLFDLIVVSPTGPNAQQNK
ncbi:hypothetical protein BaRGS_00005183 [Batillaria attramentaria]|uniref:Uncharacterized protein n=1 Tax=Batillaria attramentaria TaxID=370345 RepID=A0ABD0LVH7_9CAEN